LRLEEAPISKKQMLKSVVDGFGLEPIKATRRTMVIEVAEHVQSIREKLDVNRFQLKKIG